jgi:hypothetical protein
MLCKAKKKENGRTHQSQKKKKNNKRSRGICNIFRSLQLQRQPAWWR